MKGTLLSVCACMLICSAAVAQQFPSSYTYIFDPFSLNPAYTGYNVVPEITVANKSSFQGIEGAPRTTFFSAHGQVYDPKVSVGVGFIADKIGVTSTTGIYGSYAYKVISRNRNVYTSWGFHPHVLSLGLRAGVAHYKEDLTTLGINSDQNFERNVSFAFPNVGFGIYYSRRQYNIGFSVPELITTSEARNYSLGRHMFLNASYQLLTGASSKLNFNSLVKYVDGAPLQADISTQIEFRDKMLFGIGYRSVSRMSFMLGFFLMKGFKLGYVYDQPFGSNTREISFNNHEFMINYRFTGKQ